MFVLFRGTDQIGQYDKAEDSYRRINTDGSFSEPTQRPWRTHAAKVPPPPPIAAKIVKQKEDEKKAAAEQLAKAEQAKADAKAQAAAQTFDLEAAMENVPSWSVYAAGGGLACLALAFGIGSQFRGPRKSGDSQLPAQADNARAPF